MSFIRSFSLRGTVLALTFSAVSSFASASAAGGGATVTVDVTTDTGPVFAGWEATADLSDKPTRRDPHHDALLDHLVEDVGINRVRLEVRSGAERPDRLSSRFVAGRLPYPEYKKQFYRPVNDNDDPQVIDPRGFDFAELAWHVETSILPLRQKLAARGERLIVNLCYVSFRDEWYFHRDAEEYAEFVLATYLHLNDRYGFVPDMWEVMLEPDLDPESWTGREMGAAIVAAARRLEAHGFTPAFIGPSVTNASNAVPYFERMIAVPGAAEHIVELSYHRYRNGKPRVIAEIGRMAEAQGIRASMLEWWFGKATYQVLHEDLKLGYGGAWQGQILRGHSDFIGMDGAQAQFRMHDEVRYLAAYFRDIRQGARRVQATSSDERRGDPVAFVNTDGSVTVVVKSSGAQEVTVAGLPAGDYAIRYVIASGEGGPPDRVTVATGAPLVASMPDKGVLVVTSRRAPVRP